nr:MAG TPA: hypothetical protein [Caudoviricetes sp.]
MERKDRQIAVGLFVIQIYKYLIFKVQNIGSTKVCLNFVYISQYGNVGVNGVSSLKPNYSAWCKKIKENID